MRFPTIELFPTLEELRSAGPVDCDGVQLAVGDHVESAEPMLVCRGEITQLGWGGEPHLVAVQTDHQRYRSMAGSSRGWRKITGRFQPVDHEPPTERVAAEALAVVAVAPFMFYLAQQKEPDVVGGLGRPRAQVLRPVTGLALYQSDATIDEETGPADDDSPEEQLCSGR